MTEKALRMLLEGLHEELQHAESVDETSRALLLNLDADIHSLLERSGDDSLKVDESALKLIRTAMDHFEISHPKLTMTLSELLTVLNNAGI